MRVFEKNRFLTTAFVVFSVLILGSCTTDKSSMEGLSCPQTGFVRDAESIDYMQDGQIAVRAIFDRLGGGCRIVHNLVEQDLMIDIYAERHGDNLDQVSQDIGYFVGILDPKDALLKKQVFTKTVVFDGAGQGRVSDVITQLLPVDQAAMAGQYSVIVGFQLTPEQLEHNRDLRRVGGEF